MPFTGWDTQQLSYPIDDLPNSVDMSEVRSGSDFLWTDSLDPCYAICVYNTKGHQMLLCHADSTFADHDGEKAVSICRYALVEAERRAGVTITFYDTEVCVIRGASTSRQFNEASVVAEKSIVATFPNPLPQAPTVEVYMYPGGAIRYAVRSWF